MDAVVVQQFERKHQKQVENLFRNGLEAYSDIRDIQSSFVATQLSPSGDMHDIYVSYVVKSDEGYNFWVALSGDEVVGCVGCVPHSRDNSLELQRLSVAESHRRFGLGKKLLGTVEKWGKERPFSRIMLSTLREMNLARSFYQKNGFAEFAQEERDVSLNFTLSPHSRVIHVVYYQKLLGDITTTSDSAWSI